MTNGRGDSLTIETFKRQEKKYSVTYHQYEQLLNQLPVYMRPDRFGKNGRYTVTSLYFDTDDYKIYQHTKTKQPYRGKLRLRVYDQVTPIDLAFFELKLKHDRYILKRRTIMTLVDAYNYLTSKEKSKLGNYQTSNPLVLKEIDDFRKQYQLVPKMIVSYGRHAFHDKVDPGIRVTFDFNLRCRKEDLLLENGSYGEHFIAPDEIIMEVKTKTGQIPIWLEQMIQVAGCEKEKRSKYCASMEQLYQHQLF